MDKPSIDGSAPTVTNPYRRLDAHDSRPPVGVVAGSAPFGDHELVPLLHKRLRFLVLVFIVVSAAVILLRVAYAQYWLPQPIRTSTIEAWAHVGSLIALLGLLAGLTIPRSLTLRQLRVVELVLFAILAARVCLRGYVLFSFEDNIDRVRDSIAAGDMNNAHQMMSGLVHRLLLSSAMYVVAYGVIIPNTWRRCAIVVAAFVALPIAVWIVGCIDRGLPTDYWLSHGFTIPTLILILIGVMSVYGTYRIETSR